MIHNLKTFGLLLGAVMAMTAVTASTVQAVTLSSSSYPQTLDATSTEIGEHFLTEAGKIECHETRYHGTLGGESSTVAVKTTTSGCRAFGFLSMTVNSEGCSYLHHLTEHDAAASIYTSHVDLSCPAGQSIKITAGTCKVEYKAQNGLTTVDLTNMSGSLPDLTMRPTLKGIAYTVTQDGFGCPFGGVGNKTGGEYTSSGYVTLTAAGGLSIST